ncbi:unnamed protein product [Danaus chrysippus]|uniref:(African queen) hypothetical protein n=1 Tax=Danaus chrysippus TaxID=151541 RepID=A0A8J2W9H2_9NEOP|nr:unnamed protein product [Danaus chrysippus]
MQDHMALWPSTMSKDINGHVVVTDGMPLRRGSLAPRVGGGGQATQPAPPPLRTDSASSAHVQYTQHVIKRLLSDS